MVQLASVAAPGGDMFTMWNVEKVVGFGQDTIPLDVKFVQYLLFFVAKGMKEQGLFVFRQLPLNQVTGRWNTESNAALHSMEVTLTAGTNIIDDKVSPMPPGKMFVSPGKHYHIAVLQEGYFRLVQDIPLLGTLREPGGLQLVTDTLMEMPEFCASDMPADLSEKLKSIRPAATSSGSTSDSNADASSQ